LIDESEHGQGDVPEILGEDIESRRMVAQLMVQRSYRLTTPDVD
jgi:hypothetical protein